MIQSVESIQLALFLRAPYAGSALDLWRSGFEVEPDGFNKLPNGQTQTSWVAGNLAVTLLASSLPAPRIDVIMQGFEAQPTSALPQRISDPAAALKMGLSAVERFLPQISVGRTASVIQGSTVASDRADALAKLQALMPAMSLPANAQDVNLQFVVSRPSSISPTRVLKQMCRFQTVSMMMLNIGFGGFQPPSVAEQGHAAHLHVDVFAENVETLSPQDALASLEEVAGDALRILQGGVDELVG